MGTSILGKVADYLEKQAEQPVSLFRDAVGNSVMNERMDGAPWLSRNFWLAGFLLASPLFAVLPKIRDSVFWVFWLTFWLAWAFDLIMFGACRHKHQVDEAISAEIENCPADLIGSRAIDIKIAAIQMKLGRNKYAVAIGILVQLLSAMTLLLIGALIVEIYFN